jgi:hypothetical protein
MEDPLFGQRLVSQRLRINRKERFLGLVILTAFLHLSLSLFLSLEAFLPSHFLAHASVLFASCTHDLQGFFGS